MLSKLCLGAMVFFLTLDLMQPGYLKFADPRFFLPTNLTNQAPKK
jgi:hypothetical protein